LAIQKRRGKTHKERGKEGVPVVKSTFCATLCARREKETGKEANASPIHKGNNREKNLQKQRGREKQGEGIVWSHVASRLERETKSHLFSTLVKGGRGNGNNFPISFIDMRINGG